MIRSDRKTDIDIGLDVLCRLATPGQCLTDRDIADVCGCSRTRIYQIEKRALEKARTIAARLGLQEYIQD